MSLYDYETFIISAFTIFYAFFSLGNFVSSRNVESIKVTKVRFFIEKACVAEWLTPQTPDLEVWASSLAHHIVSLDKELYSLLSLFIQVYKWVLQPTVEG